MVPSTRPLPCLVKVWCGTKWHSLSMYIMHLIMLPRRLLVHIGILEHRGVLVPAHLFVIICFQFRWEFLQTSHFWWPSLTCQSFSPKLSDLMSLMKMVGPDLSQLNEYWSRRGQVASESVWWREGGRGWGREMTWHDLYLFLCVDLRMTAGGCEIRNCIFTLLLHLHKYIMNFVFKMKKTSGRKRERERERWEKEEDKEWGGQTFLILMGL
jgi:hypothetical protein